MSTPEIPELLIAIRSILNQERTQLQQTVNHTMVQAYWNVGRLVDTPVYSISKEYLTIISKASL